MGLTYSDFSVWSVDQKTEKKVNFLVDTGSLYSLIPEKLAKELNLQRLGDVELELADMTIIKKPLSFCLFGFEDRRGAANVVLCEDNVEPLLGATALEAMNLSVDPADQKISKNKLAKLKSLKSADNHPRL